MVGHATLDNWYTIHVSCFLLSLSLLTPNSISWSHLTIPYTYAFSHTVSSTGMSSSHWNLIHPWRSSSIASFSVELPSLPKLVVISSSSQILKKFVYCQNGYSEYLSTGMTKYWPIKRGASWIVGPGIDLSCAAKLVPRDLSSSSGLLQGRDLVCFCKYPVRHATQRVLHVMCYVHYFKIIC